jgi:hypothetical protein
VDSNTALMISVMAGLGLFALIYFIPTITAFRRKHPHRGYIALVNLFFGGTGFGWIGALLWALQSGDDREDRPYKRREPHSTRPARS